MIVSQLLTTLYLFEPFYILIIKASVLQHLGLTLKICPEEVFIIAVCPGLGFLTPGYHLRLISHLVGQDHVYYFFIDSLDYTSFLKRIPDNASCYAGPSSCKLEIGCHLIRRNLYFKIIKGDCLTLAYGLWFLIYDTGRQICSFDRHIGSRIHEA